MRVQDLAEEFGAFQQRVDARHDDHQSQMSRVETRLDDYQNQMTLIVTQLQQLNNTILSIDARTREPHPRPSQFDATSSGHIPRVDPHDSRNLSKAIRLEIPLFSGVDPNSWLFRTELFFMLQQIPDEFKVPLAGLRMEGMAAAWYQWMYNSGLIRSWSDLSRGIRERFGVSAYTNLKGVLSKLVQSGSLRDYIQQFEVMINQVPGLDDDLYMSFFVSGLQTELRSAVQLRSPLTLHQAMQLALAFDDHHSELRASFNVTARKFSAKPFPTQESATVALPTTQIPQLTNTTPTLALPAPPMAAVKKFSHVDFHKKRELGLCYYCDEKWNAKHRCKNKLLLMVGDLTDQRTDAEEEEEIVWQSEDMVKIPHEGALHALSTQQGNRSLIFLTVINGSELPVLIDSGSTHNFIRKQLACELKLPMTRAKKMRVFLGNGEFLVADRKCLNVPIVLQGHLFTVDLWVLELIELSVVLGMPWLEKLGRVTHNYVRRSMEFCWQGQQVVLEGLKKHERPMLTDGNNSVETTHCYTLIHQGEECILMPAPELLAMQAMLPECLWQILLDFQDVFQVPNELPPFRGLDHAIHLVEGSKPINVEPYRYAHHQKTEIEKQVTDLLTAGFIQHSQSPFSSPVLLVRKQDNSWRMCIDYRALNAVTIKDRFPIPTIDELLDELGGAKVFSKLDLRAGYHQIRVLAQDIPKQPLELMKGTMSS
ncbi:uncharacterized protein LOC133293510 [Gastrolobium bilobum]|uniref:uncharacterized protein LOC133293510 n=1 Tax=Gastrolobium bilobum TaxID=150636 RepID=UPI002AB192BC|nr:uncharacterized protein LOC133293510 [Gastrolobium bilobum]